MARLFAFFAMSFLTATALTPFCRYVANRTGFVAKPKHDRWHKRPTPLFGGAAIVVTVSAFALIANPDARVWHLLACGIAIAGFGFVDDSLSLKPSTKLIAQITVACVLVFFDYRLGWTESMLGDAMLTVFWIVGITNGFNLLDNMDGLCAGTTLIAGSFLLLSLYAATGVTPPAIYLAVLLGATGGFLVYNVYPASIFLGDTGSLFLGLNLSVLTLISRAAGNATGTSELLSVVAAPVLMLLIPIFDTTLVTVMRLLSGRRPSEGGRDHSSHRLVAVGLPEPTAVAVLWGLAILGGGIAFSLQIQDHSLAGISALTFAIAMVIFAVYLASIRVYDDARPAPLERVTPLFVDFMYKRRVAEVLLDLCLIPLAYYSAYRLRFEGVAFTENYQYFLRSLPVVLSAQLVSLFIVGGYRGSWRYFGMMDAVVFAKGVVLGTTVSILVMVFGYNFANYSRAAFVIYAALMMLLLSGTRASFRLLGEFVDRRRTVGQRCVVYGISGAGLATIREAFGGEPFQLLGFIDDDPRQIKGRLSGYPVLGDFVELIKLIEARHVDCVVLNLSICDVERLCRLVETCGNHDVDLMRLHLNLKPFILAS